ncbi:MAG: transporter substrate-binding domain-containing protein [Gammaproteobacteria bacterium]|nr:transporter substrate-binding domain-containing protein [Gammaproteobacteria bacterium]
MTVVFVFVIANIFIASIAIGLQYYFSKSMAIESASARYSLIAQNTRDYLDTLDSQAVNTAKILSKYSNLISNGQINSLNRELFSEVIQNYPVFFAVYIGFGNGDFYQVINLELSPARDKFAAQASDRWLIVKITRGINGGVKTFEYYDENFNLRTTESEPTRYLSSSRPWYLKAKLETVYKSDPYLFNLSGESGQTYSMAIPNSDAVLGIDIALSSLSDYLAGQTLGADSEIFLYKESGEIIASNLEKLPRNIELEVKPITLSPIQQQFVDQHRVIKISNSMDWAPIDFAVSGVPNGYVIDFTSIISKMTGLEFQYINGFRWPELVEKFKNKEIDILQAIFNNDDNANDGIISDPFVKLPFALITRSNVPKINHIGRLAGRKLGIAAGWSITNSLKQNFPKIDIIEFGTLKEVINAVRDGKVYAGLDIGVILEYVTDQYFVSGLKMHLALNFLPTEFPDQLHFLLQPDQRQLNDLINRAIENITPEQRKYLSDKWLVTKARNSTSSGNGIVPYVELINGNFNKNQDSGFKMGKINGEDYFVFSKYMTFDSGQRDVFSIVTPARTVLAESSSEVMLSITISIICLLILFPLSWLFATPIVNPIRQLILQNKQIKDNKFSGVGPIQSNIFEIDELSKSLNEMAHSIEAKKLAQQELLESFIKIISQAIDDKSPYTAGHCERVPELAIMLADSASQSQSMPFKDFSFNDLERREFSIAAWLHDCGKVTSPEHIIDKGTKLEVIYNRIHEIRMRFEVLWRDADIVFLTELHRQPENKQMLAEILRIKKAKLVDDFEFIATSNVGGEFMMMRDLKRLKELSTITWQRNFNDQLGLSPLEVSTLTPNTQALPVTENLLMDKPSHLVKRTHDIKFDPKFNIKMTVPEYLYNQGELYNLCIKRGTLTPEDRFKINEHIISTIKMLEALPLPPELANVPRYASTHHETMKGTGYPRKLSAEQLSIPERIMVVSDIFEALTAADRPYKAAKRVSTVIEILYQMAVDQHIDMDIFKLLLSSGIYLEYAKKYLPQEQIDKVDINQYLEQLEPA